MAKETSSGLGLSGALFLVFLVLKLTNQIAWSWWWVTAPLWALPTLCFSLLGVLSVIALIADGKIGLKLFLGAFLRAWRK